VVLLAELRALVPDGERWLHEARFWLRHEAAAELGVRLGGAEVVGVRLDGSPVPRREPEGGRLWLSLAGPGGVREVVVRYRRHGEPLDRPDLTPPRLEGARPGPALWTVEVPPGWELTGPGGGRGIRPLGAGATRRMALELHRAAVALAVCRELAG